MAITLEANYAKKLGLPNYSSHQYSVTIRAELSDLSQVAAESSRLDHLLQEAVDREIQEVGFLPDAKTYGMRPSITADTNHDTSNPSAANGYHTHPAGTENGTPWACSDKQRELILKLVSEKHLNKGEVEHLAQERFGRGVRQLGKLQASQLIEVLSKQGRNSALHGSGHSSRQLRPASRRLQR